MKSHNIVSSSKPPILVLFATLLMLSGGLFATAAQANQTCDALFMSVEDRAHLRQWREFVNTENFDGRLTNTAAKAHILLALLRIFPAGEHPVLLNFRLPDTLIVDYTKDGNVTIRLPSRTLVQSDGIPLKRGYWLAPNVSYGIDARVQLLANGRARVSTTVIRGDEKTMAGLDRTDTAIEFDPYGGPKQDLMLTETNTNWSVYRIQLQSKTSQTRIQRRN